MKAITLTAVAVSLLQLTAAQPFRNRRHAHQHQKKDVIVTVTELVYDNSPEVIVYVDQFGNQRSTLTNNVPAYTTSTLSTSTTSSSSSSLASASSSSSVAPTTSTSSSLSSTSISSTSIPATSTSTSVYVAPTPTTTSSVSEAHIEAALASTSSTTPVATTSSAVSVATSSSYSAEAGGLGFAYTPYTASGDCKTQAQITEDFADIDSSYSMVRIYGTDCNQASTILTAAKAKGLKIFAGIYYLATLSDEIELLVSAASGDWSSFDTIAIGNELVDSGTATAAEVVAGIATARTLLKAAGYTGNIVTVDTLVAARANPELCNESDYCAVNCHPFFDDSTSASEAGSFITTQIATLKAVLSDSSQQIVITETGWPWKGNSHGAASVSLADQTTAIAAIKSDVSVTTILLSAYNDLWKVAASATYDAEQYWGIGGKTAPSDSS